MNLEHVAMRFGPMPQYLLSNSMKGLLRMATYSKEDKRKWNQRFWQKKRRAGWKFYGFCLPEHIGNELLNLKRQRMEEYRNSHMSGEVKLP